MNLTWFSALMFRFSFFFPQISRAKIPIGYGHMSTSVNIHELLRKEEGKKSQHGWGQHKHEKECLRLRLALISGVIEKLHRGLSKALRTHLALSHQSRRQLLSEMSPFIGKKKSQRTAAGNRWRSLRNEAKKKKNEIGRMFRMCSKQTTNQGILLAMLLDFNR